MSGCEQNEKLLATPDRVPPASLMGECKLIAPPSHDVDDQLLGIYIKESDLYAQICAREKKALMDWLLKKAP